MPPTRSPSSKQSKSTPALVQRLGDGDAGRAGADHAGPGAGIAHAPKPRRLAKRPGQLAAACGSRSSATPTCRRAPGALPERCLELIRASDLVVHTGDFTGREALELIEAIGPPLVAVHGNVDEPAIVERLPADGRASSRRAGMRSRRDPRRRAPPRPARAAAATLPERGGGPLRPLPPAAPRAAPRTDSRSSTPAARPSAAGRRPARWGRRRSTVARSPSAMSTSVDRARGFGTMNGEASGGRRRRSPSIAKGRPCSRPTGSSPSYPRPSWDRSPWRRPPQPSRRGSSGSPRGSTPRAAATALRESASKPGEGGKAKAGSALARRPALPADRQRRLRRAPLRDRPRLRPGDEPFADGTGTTMRAAGDPGPLASSQPRLPGRPDRLRGHRRRAARPFKQVDATPAFSASIPDGRPSRRSWSSRPPQGYVKSGTKFERRRRLQRRPRSAIIDADDSIEGWIRACSAAELTLRRLLHRQRADRRAELVPVQQLPDRQGDVRDHDHRPGPHVALGAGELEARIDNGDGTRPGSGRRTTRPPPSCSATVGPVRLLDVAR